MSVPDELLTCKRRRAVAACSYPYQSSDTSDDEEKRLNQKCQAASRRLDLSSVRTPMRLLSGRTYTVLTNKRGDCDNLMIFISRKHEMCYGQWSCSVCPPANSFMYDEVDLAYDLGYKCVIMGYEPALLYRHGSGEIAMDNVHRHMQCVWHSLFSNKKSVEKLIIVAHGFAGNCAIALLESYFEEHIDKLVAVAFLDSFHTKPYGKNLENFLEKNSFNWVTSSKDLNSVVLEKKGDATMISADTVTHEHVPCKTRKSVRSYLTVMNRAFDERRQLVADRVKRDGGGNCSCA